MSLLQLPRVESATGETKEILEEIQAAFGMIPNGIRQLSVSPSVLKAQWGSIQVRMSKDKENQKLHTMIRYLISDESQCSYCIGVNGGMLVNMFGMTQDEVLALAKDNATAPLDEKDKALLLLAIKSIKDADAVNAQYIAELKKLGISDLEMFDIVHAAGHMLTLNTLFKTFKVQQDY